MAEILSSLGSIPLCWNQVLHLAQMEYYAFNTEAFLDEPKVFKTLKDRPSQAVS